MMQPAQAQPDPKGAIWRSMVMPGWGHYYADSSDWTRGQYHLAADVILIGAYFGFDARASNLQQQYLTLANLKAGVNVDNRDRSFRLAIGNFDSLEEYNDHQLRTRNWNRLIDNVPENRWNWQSTEDRMKYSELREDVDRTRQQLPALISLMVVNRVVSGVSAYLRARDMADIPEVSVGPVMEFPGSKSGYKASIRFRF